jgi:hypothetical protein
MQHQRLQSPHLQDATAPATPLPSPSPPRTAKRKSRVARPHLKRWKRLFLELAPGRSSPHILHGSGTECSRSSLPAQRQSTPDGKAHDTCLIGGHASHLPRLPKRTAANCNDEELAQDAPDLAKQTWSTTSMRHIGPTTPRPNTTMYKTRAGASP